VPIDRHLIATEDIEEVTDTQPLPMPEETLDRLTSNCYPRPDRLADAARVGAAAVACERALGPTAAARTGHTWSPSLSYFSHGRGIAPAGIPSVD